jgi:cobalt-zinc-cadmium efflux system protein
VSEHDGQDGHAHDHAGHAGHGRGAHSHAPSVDADSRWLLTALGLILAFMVVEVVAGILASSLALITDAGHMLTDAAAIALALLASRLARRPAKGAYTYGLKRVEILSAQANGITLLLLAVWFTYEAVRRLLDPPEVHGGLVLGTALAGVVVNLVAAWCMSRADRRSLNVEGAFQHVLSDLYAFIATAIAGLVVVLTGWHQADAVAALVVAALMTWAGSLLLRESWRIFLEAAPRGIDVGAVGDALRSATGVLGVHDLHVWEVTSGFAALSAHVLVDPDHDCHERRQQLSDLLAHDFGITHATLQVDHPDRVLIPTEQLLRRPEDAPPERRH